VATRIRKRRVLLRVEEEEEEKEDGKGMTMVKGRGTEVEMGGEPSKEGVERIPAESSPRRLK